MAGYASFFTGNSTAIPDPAAPARYRLLIVDDEPNVLKALQRVFRQENYEVLTAPDGDEALRLCSATPVDVVISDYMMPKMNGAELLRRFKQTWPDTIRIMLSGHADTGAVMGAVNEGAVYKFILKPWNDDDLRVTVALALEQHDLIRRNRQLQAENSKKSQEIQALSRLAVTNRSQLAIMLHKKGMLNEQQVQELHKLSQLRKEPMLRLLLAREWVSEKAIRAILRKDLLIEEVALAEHTLEPALAELLPRSFCERNWVLPLRLEGKRLTLVMADPMDTGLIDDLRFSAGLEVQTVMADSAAIESKILDLYGTDSGPSFGDMETLVAMTDPFESIEIVIDEEYDVSLEELLHQTEELPAVRLVNAIILEAVRLRASDIHIQPRAKSVVVRYRIDGILKDKLHIPHQIFSSLVSRIKIMAELDIAERRRPQDGRITVKTPLRIVDLRLSTLPTISGEKVVMRLLDRNAAISDLSALGFAADDQERVQRLTEKPQGIILATGPTGSGKTNTLYSLLQHNADPGRNYVTIEDPVEFFMDMAGQVHIREQIGLTFPIVLRSILRQDPDVILLGEIRDFDTAEVAFHAALTGHLVFSTLHTNSAVATVARLFDLGLKPYVVAAALEGIIAQRLVRRLCLHCREPVAPDPVVSRKLGPLFGADRLPEVFHARGCGQCGGTGYQGRIGLFEVLVPDDELRHLMTSGASMLEINRAARVQGVRSLLQDAWEKVRNGSTDMAEILRVLGPQQEPV
jgi:type II secretory ATPase GspE/PulE/Tfp pilus assembly ATPase PilB-like protein/DNA-binding response OmpR family regulator